MNKDRGWEDEHPFTNDACHLFDRTAQQHLLWPDNRHRLTGQLMLNQSCFEDVHHVFYGYRLNGLFLEANGGEQRKAMECVAEVIEHVVTLAINHPGFDDRVIQSRISDDFFRRPFGLVVRRTATGPRPQKAKQKHFFHSGGSCGVHHVLCSLDVNTLIRLLTNGTVDTCTMSNRFTPHKCLGKLFHRGSANSSEGYMT